MKLLTDILVSLYTAQLHAPRYAMFQILRSYVTEVKSAYFFLSNWNRFENESGPYYSRGDSRQTPALF